MRITSLNTWYEKASVRHFDRLMVDKDEEIATKKFFPAHIIPHLQHPLVAARPLAQHRYLAAQYLYQWLHFTARFEVEVVLRTTHRIADGVSGLELPRSVRRDAMKICVDEQYHALYSVDVADQIEDRSGIPALPYDFAPFVRHLDGVGASDPQYTKLVQLLQVVVFETLITSLLDDVPRDPELISVVRETVRDHATDESYHHAYFASLFMELWTQLSPVDRRVVAHLLPQVIVRSLQPATRSARLALEQVGFSTAQIEDILADSYGPQPVMDGIRHAARRTIGLFRRAGVFEVPGAQDAFHQAGFRSTA